jgi:flavorubredoxin
VSNVLAEGISWVGYVDREIRDFHGYQTLRGSTYNAYLVQDDKTALIDAVKGPFASYLIDNIKNLADLDSVDYVVCNHAEPDHSGGLPAVMDAIKGAELVCNAKCKDALSMHYDTSGWNFKVVEDGEELSLGKRTLKFVNTPMVHWPESMFTYVPEEKILFSMDAFGQHYSAENRFDDEEPLEVIMEEAKTYYANIVMLYGKTIGRVLEKAGGLDIEMIAPSHGVIWRKNINAILSAYLEWIECKPSKKVMILYDTMWKSTEMMARAVAEGAEKGGVDVRVYNIRNTHITNIATESLDVACIAVGSPTLNKILMPQVAAVLTYLKGLAPINKAGFAFGSYGWTKGGPGDVNRYLEEMKFEILREPIECRFVPTDEVLDECRAAGSLLATKAMEKVNDA